MASIADPDTGPPFYFRIGFIAALHALLLATALVPGDDLSARPIANVDYASHFYAATHFAEHFANTGSFWGYDPHWMAGFPEGFVSLADNKLFDVLVWLAPGPLEPAVFNATVLLCVLAVPWALHAASRLVGGTRADAGGAAIAGVALAFGAPMTMIFWTGGGISFFFSSLLSVPAALALVKVLTEGRLRSGLGARAIALAMLVAFVHPFGLVPLLAALGTTLGSGPVGPDPDRRPASRPKRKIITDLMVIAFFLFLPLIPLVIGVLENRGQTRLFTHLFPGGPQQFVRDWVTYLFRTDDRSFDGAGALAAVIVAAFTGWRARSPSLPFRRAILAAMVVTAFLAYVAAPLHPRLAALQPQRFLVGFGFFAAIFAGPGLAILDSQVRARRYGSWIVLLLLIAFAVEGNWSLKRVRILATGHDAAEAALPAFLAEHAADDGRVLVESGLWPIPATPTSRRQTLVHRFTLLPLTVEREFIGVTGLGLFAAQRYAGFGFDNFLGRRLPTVSGEELRELLARFAISTVVACSPAARSAFARFPDLLDPRAELADCLAFRVRDPETSRLLEGDGEVRAGLDRIEVRGASGERLVLKYHWLPTLRTEPPLPIDEHRKPGWPVGFIAVRPGGVENFAVVQR